LFLCDSKRVQHLKNTQMKLITYLLYTLLILLFMECSVKPSKDGAIDTLIIETPDTVLIKQDTIVNDTI